jgi:hypothetical protein
MLVSGIKSKPVYSPLRADVGGRHHVMLGCGLGGVALLRVLQELEQSSPAALRQTNVLFVPGAAIRDSGTSNAASNDASETLDRLRRTELAGLRLFGDTSRLLAEFRSLLEQSLMGTRVYVAGPESFIGLAMRIAREFNLNKDEIRAEELGTRARRVYCVHCRTTAEDVRTNIVRCAGCHRWLLVRDHYSRRLAAYMGVMADAEAPGELPPIREVYT